LKFLLKANRAITKFTPFLIITLYIAEGLEISRNCVSFVGLVKVKFFHLKKGKSHFSPELNFYFMKRGRHIFCFEAICQRYNTMTALTRLNQSDQFVTDFCTVTEFCTAVIQNFALLFEFNCNEITNHSRVILLCILLAKE
jgi:hypothetical protein